MRQMDRWWQLDLKDKNDNCRRASGQDSDYANGQMSDSRTRSDRTTDSENKTKDKRTKNRTSKTVRTKDSGRRTTE